MFQFSFSNNQRWLSDTSRTWDVSSGHAWSASIKVGVSPPPVDLLRRRRSAGSAGDRLADCKLKNIVWSVQEAARINRPSRNKYDVSGEQQLLLPCSTSRQHGRTRFPPIMLSALVVMHSFLRSNFSQTVNPTVQMMQINAAKSREGSSQACSCGAALTPTCLRN